MKKEKSVVIRNDGDTALIRQPNGGVLKVTRDPAVPKLDTKELERDFDWRHCKPPQ